MALYDFPHGYYMTQAVEQGRQARNRIGWEGDFFTAPELSPILAVTLVRQALEIDAQLGHPPTFMVVEVGGGTGSFVKDFLRECQATAPDFLNRLSYHIVECSPYLKTCQMAKVQEVLGEQVEPSLRWWESIDQLPADFIEGIVFSNELVDALPVHRVRHEEHGLKEVRVDYQDGRFVERFHPCSTPALTDYIEQHQVSVREGQTTELHLASQAWMTQVANSMKRGAVVTIDYGHTTEDYYSSDRPEGTLLCYFQHAISKNPYIRVGEQDMTAHVNFSCLATSGKWSGLMPVGFTTMANWLMSLGVEDLVMDKDQDSEEVQALMQLLRPHGMGKTFKVLVQQKDMELGTVQGLRYPAFFGDVL